MNTKMRGVGLKVDWAKVHQAFGDEYQWFAVDASGVGFVFNTLPQADGAWSEWHSKGDNTCEDVDENGSGYWETASEVDWDKEWVNSLVVFDGVSVSGETMEDVVTILRAQVVTGKEAAKTLKAMEKAIAARKEIEAKYSKVFADAGIELAFMVK